MYFIYCVSFMFSQLLFKYNYYMCGMFFRIHISFMLISWMWCILFQLLI